MAQANLLLELEDEIDENNLLLNFYQANLQYLREFPLHTIPHDLKKETASNFYGLSFNKDDWIGVLEALGVDKTTIYDIDFRSRSFGIPPLYLAINGVLKIKNTSLGEFIDVLRRADKFNILLLLKPFAEELLSKRYSLNERHYSEPKPSAPSCSSLDVTSSIFNSCGSEVNSAPLDTGYDSISCQGINGSQLKCYKTDLEHFQNSDVTSIANKKQLYAVSNSLNKNQSLDKLISVFIMHSMLDKKYAKKLAKCLKEKNFRVVTSANIYQFLRENPSLIMKAVDEQVDFVVPVVSESFTKQIKFTGFDATEEKDLESVANTFLYDRLLNEYSQKRFLNRRVRPVCYSKEIRKLEKLDQILSWSAYLPYTDLGNDELLESELLRHLRSSKKRLECSK